jgi:hypothetical protein
MFQPYKAICRQLLTIVISALLQFICQCNPCCCISPLPLKCVCLRIKGGQHGCRKIKITRSEQRVLVLKQTHFSGKDDMQHHGMHNVAYLPHARKFEPQNQPFLSNTRTNNGTAGLRGPFLGYVSVNTLPRRRMTSRSNSTGWESPDLFTARYSLRNNITGFLCVVGAKAI